VVATITTLSGYVGGLLVDGNGNENGNGNVEAAATVGGWLQL